MNILILTHSYPDLNNRWRGTFISDQAKALSSDHDVTVVYFKVDYSHFAMFAGCKFSKKETGSLTEYSVITGRSLPVINQLKYLYNAYRFISDNILKVKRIDIIHCHLSYPAGFLGTVIQKMKGIPNIITEHSWIKKYFRSRIHKICTVFALKNCSCIVAVSNALKTDIESYTKNRIIVVPNVVDIERFPLVKPKRNDRINLGTLGGYSNYIKGLDILLNSVSLLRDKNILLHIGGDGTLLDNFKRMARELCIEDKCKFYGEIMPDKVAEFYSGLDIFILASRSETFGVVLIEAMSCGLPVIATKCGGPQDILIPSTGMLVNPGNARDLADALIYLSENLESFDRAAIRKYTETKFGQTAFLNNISLVYKSIFNTGKT